MPHAEHIVTANRVLSTQASKQTHEMVPDKIDLSAVSPHTTEIVRLKQIQCHGKDQDTHPNIQGFTKIARPDALNFNRNIRFGPDSQSLKTPNHRTKLPTLTGRFTKNDPNGVSKAVKEPRCIMWARRGFRMKLHPRHHTTPALDARDSLVIQVLMTDL